MAVVAKAVTTADVEKAAAEEADVASLVAVAVAVVKSPLVDGFSLDTTAE